MSNIQIKDLQKCRHCIQWYDTLPFRGNCWKHPWDKDKYSQDAEPGPCQDYRNKYDVREAICQGKKY